METGWEGGSMRRTVLAHTVSSTFRESPALCAFSQVRNSHGVRRCGTRADRHWRAARPCPPWAPPVLWGVRHGSREPRAARELKGRPVSGGPGVVRVDAAAHTRHPKAPGREGPEGQRQACLTGRAVPRSWVIGRSSGAADQVQDGGKEWACCCPLRLYCLHDASLPFPPAALASSWGAFKAPA